MKRVLLICSSICIALLSFACGTNQLPNTATDPPVATALRPTSTDGPSEVDIRSITPGRYPRVDGSTSTYPLQFMIGCTVLDVPCTWAQGDFFEPTRRIVPDEDAVFGNEVETLSSMFHSGTHDAYMNLIWKNSDLILVAREPSQDEMEAASVENVEFDIQAVARDAFVFLVHADNPVESLSLQEIRDIYTGRITNWVQVGGLDAEIHTYQRNRNSGSQELMEKLVMQGRTMRDSPDMILEGMMGPINAIRDDPYGIGYSVYFYAANIFIDENVRMLAVDGIAPTSSSIADNSYSLATEVFAVTRDNTPKWGNAAKLRDWLLTEDGQEAVEASGYVSVSG